jgi:hypothetical protein
MGFVMPPVPKPLYGINAFKHRLDLKWNKLKYNKWSNDLAYEKYARIVSADPSRALSHAQQSEITDYAGDVFGNTRFARWLMTYAAVRKEFRPGCIPDNYVGTYMLKNVVGPWKARLERVKQRRVFDTDLIPEILSCVNGRLSFPDNSEVPPDQLKAVIFERGDRAVLKLGASNQSRAVSILSKDGFHPDMLPTDRDFVIQHMLRQDPDLDRFCAGAATTLRITTAMTQTGADTREVRMRFARAGETYLKAATEACVSVDRKTGAYFAEGSDYDWAPITRHPDSGEPFSGNTLTGMNAMKQACEKLHEEVPGIAWLGWDICPMANGEFAIMEVNCGHASIRFAEAHHGPNYDDMGWETLHLRYPL